MNDLKTKVDDLNVGKLKTVHADLKSLKKCERHNVQQTKYETK